MHEPPGRLTAGQPRSRTVLRWNSRTLDSALYDLSRTGSPGGLAVLEQGRGIEGSPFAVGRVQTDFHVRRGAARRRICERGSGYFGTRQEMTQVRVDFASSPPKAVTF
jgi:hypothetical protein